MLFESVSEHFVNIQHVKRGKTSVPGLDALFRGTKRTKMVSQWNQQFYPIKPQMMFESVSKHFVNIQHVKRGKTSVPGLDALFRGTELAKMVSQQNQPFYPVRYQTIFESVSKQFANFQHVERG